MRVASVSSSKIGTENGRTRGKLRKKALFKNINSLILHDMIDTWMPPGARSVPSGVGASPRRYLLRCKVHRAPTMCASGAPCCLLRTVHRAPTMCASDAPCTLHTKNVSSSARPARQACSRQRRDIATRRAYSDTRNNSTLGRRLGTSRRRKALAGRVGILQDTVRNPRALP